MTGMPTPALLSAHALRKSYRKHRIEIPVLRGLDLSVPRGLFLSIVGASGSGKSTLLHLLGTLDRPDDGRIFFAGERIDHLSGRARDRLRNEVFGYVFQFYHLLPELTVLENVVMPLMIRHSALGWCLGRRRFVGAARELLERVGLGHRYRHKPSELSGGEMQRAAIARALLNRPQVLLADEPTGNLDAATGADIVRLLRALNREDGLTVVMVTHNLEIAAQGDQVVKMSEGHLEPTALAA
jgi:lipoprotein-releasing system ATP-binding protein